MHPIRSQDNPPTPSLTMEMARGGGRVPAKEDHMTPRLDATEPTRAERGTPRRADPYLDGIVAGTIGAATIALWFLILDTIKGRPLYTPSVLGSVLFKPGAPLPALESVPISFQLVLVYTWVHWMVFCLIGAAASVLLRVAERRPEAGFGILLIFVLFEFGFLVGAMLFAEAILQAIAWQEILLGNLLAAVAMGAFLWRRHPHIMKIIRP